MELNGQYVIRLRHTGKCWMAWCEQHAPVVYTGRSQVEAAGKLLVAMKEKLGLSIESRWDDHIRSIPLPIGLRPDKAIALLKEAKQSAKRECDAFARMIIARN